MAGVVDAISNVNIPQRARSLMVGRNINIIENNFVEEVKEEVKQ